MDSDEDILLLQGIKHMDKKVKEVMGKNNVERETKVKNNAKNSEKAKKKRQIKMYTSVRWNTNIYVSAVFFFHVQSSTTTDEEEEEKNTMYII